MTIQDRNLNVGMTLIGRYHKQEHHCQVIAGEGNKIKYKLEDGREFKSPSAAAMSITGHAADGWHFWTVVTAEAANPQTPESPNSEPHTAESASSSESKDAPATDAAAETTGQTFMRTPNQKGAPEGQTRWYCAECGESFLAHYGEIPSACPQGHKA